MFILRRFFDYVAVNPDKHIVYIAIEEAYLLMAFGHLNLT